MKESGWRKPTPGLWLAERHAKAGEGKSVSKGRALSAIKRVGISLGLKAGDLLLLDMMGAFSQEKDWESGQRPIVWPSNACLMGRTGFSLSALKRRLRKLAEAGLISFVDSPNGKRWGRRDAEGHISEAYGIDLAPLRARVDEFEQLEREIQATNGLCARLRRQIIITRRMLRARIDVALSGGELGPWDRLQAILRRLTSKLPNRQASPDLLRATAARWTTLRRLIDKYEFAAIEPPHTDESTDPPFRMDPTGSENEPLIQTTKEPESVCYNDLPRDQKDIHKLVPKVIPESHRTLSNPLESIEPILACCPDFVTWAGQMGGEIRNWSDFQCRTLSLAPMIGISADTWLTAQQALGPRIAAAALALVFQKTCEGGIRAPGSYLLGMLKRARMGELHLARSFHGRLATIGTLKHSREHAD